MLSLLRARISWEPRDLTGYEAIRARLMSRTLVWLIVLVALQLPITLLTQGLHPLLWLPAGFVAQYLLVLAVLQSGHRAAAARLFTVSTLAAMLPLIAWTGGLEGSTALFVLPSALLCLTWLDEAEGVLAVLGHVAVVAAVPLVQARFPVVGLDTSADPVAMLVTALLAIGLTVGLVGVTLDTQLAAQAEVALRVRDTEAATAAARRSTEAKTRFLATMSHELRTPLNAILGYAQLLREDGGPAEADIARIETAGAHLLELVEDVLEVARAESAPRPLRSEPVDVVALVRAQAPPHVVVRQEAPILVSTDPTHLRRLLRNLLSTDAHASAETRTLVDIEAVPGEVRIRLRPEVPGPLVPLDPHRSTRLGLAVGQGLAKAIGARLTVQGGEVTLTLSASEAR